MAGPRRAAHGRRPRGAGGRYPGRAGDAKLAKAVPISPLDFHPDAAQEANDAVDYHDGLCPGLGDDFRAELDAVLARIQQNPTLYAVESGSVRLCPLHRFPYSVYYAALPDQIWVAAVGHQSRRPGYWSRRKPS
jgi:plasmid stabilization system protein ParE